MKIDRMKTNDKILKEINNDIGSAAQPKNIFSKILRIFKPPRAKNRNNLLKEIREKLNKNT